jgi:uncharacterized integral membrane protein
MAPTLLNGKGMLRMPGRKRLIIGLLIIALILFFIVENSTTATVYFFWSELSIPLWVVVVVPFLIGMLAGGLFVWGEQRKEVRNQQLHGSPALSALADVGKKRRTKWWW